MPLRDIVKVFLPKIVEQRCSSKRWELYKVAGLVVTGEINRWKYLIVARANVWGVLISANYLTGIEKKGLVGLYETKPFFVWSHTSIAFWMYCIASKNRLLAKYTLCSVPELGILVGLVSWRSSMVELLTCNEDVVGSSPIASSIEKLLYKVLIRV